MRSYIRFPYFYPKPAYLELRPTCIHKFSSNSLSTMSRVNGKGYDMTIRCKYDVTKQFAFFDDEECIRKGVMVMEKDLRGIGSFRKGISLNL